MVRRDQVRSTLATWPAFQYIFAQLSQKSIIRFVSFCRSENNKPPGAGGFAECVLRLPNAAAIHKKYFLFIFGGDGGLAQVYGRLLRGHFSVRLCRAG